MEFFKDKVLLITGGTGSFGRAMVDRLLGSGIREIRVFSRDEKKQEDMRKEYGEGKLRFYIGDVRDCKGVDEVMKGVNYVFHAAALKQVPSCEFFPMEAVYTNIVGCENVLSSAVRGGVERVVVLSTDKAVYPVNAMGMTKALSEKIMVARARYGDSGRTVFCGTRYGNVVVSRGSVIPLFVEQILKGKSLTVTDPRMTRFMMTLDEAVDLVCYALEKGNSGDILVQKSPSATVGDLAEAMLEYFGSGSGITVIGTRHGEKLYETLVNREEMVRSEDLGRYYRIPVDTRGLDYGSYFNTGEKDITMAEEYTSHNADRLDRKGILGILGKVISKEGRFL